MKYKEVEFFDIDSGRKEILVAFLSKIGFETFDETGENLKAYIPESEFRAKIFQEEITDRFQSLSFSIAAIPQQNWNEVWEKNFEPVLAGDVYIRAPFHESKPGLKHELIIEPKMSFGTGHHATTTLMIMEMLKTDFKDRIVLDMGCGTSVLGILASKLGAKNILAIDIDDWAVENSKENCSRNNVSNVEVLKGDAGSIPGRHFGIILANINRNVLLNDMPVFASTLPAGGVILLSGFYESDMPIIRESAESNGLIFKSSDSVNEWGVMRFGK